jgi:TrmH family RNA methyltransferase
LLSEAQRKRVDVVLVSPRNPLNIGAAARAMANFGFARLTVVAPFAAHWREARSAIGAPDLLKKAQEVATLAEAVANCTLVIGTGTLTRRKAEQRAVLLPNLPPVMREEVARKGRRAAIVFGPEKRGLTREDLSQCHLLVEIPTDARQPSMNLGQAVAVCLYELSRIPVAGNAAKPRAQEMPDKADAATLDRLAGLVEQCAKAAGYSPAIMEAANRHDLRLMLRRLQFNAGDARRALGVFRRILWRLEHPRN